MKDTIKDVDNNFIRSLLASKLFKKCTTGGYFHPVKLLMSTGLYRESTNCESINFFSFSLVVFIQFPSSFLPVAVCVGKRNPILYFREALNAKIMAQIEILSNEAKQLLPHVRSSPKQESLRAKKKIIDRQFFAIWIEISSSIFGQ